MAGVKRKVVYTRCLRDLNKVHDFDAFYEYFAPAKGVGRETGARVQISLTPPNQPIFNDKSLNVG